MDPYLKRSVTQGGIKSGFFDSFIIQVTMLEMKELNERQRAEHASRMHARLKDAMDEVERRNQELETKFAEVCAVDADLQLIWVICG